ncbi:MAG: hypothetical protein GF350_10440 [Chitinivibrionales bacterium]|nr:hypothetical protein [Chitinivibrionales bacterium]
MNRVALTVLALCVSIHGFSISDTKRACVNSIIETLVKCEFSTAFRKIDSLTECMPTDPIGPFLKTYGIGLKDLDLDFKSDPSGFMESYNTTLSLITALETDTDTTSYTITLRGFTKATYAAYSLRNKEYGAAVQVGLEAIKELRRAQELDPANSDADLFLGLYDYAKGELRKQLWWVLFWFPGSKEQGIRRLENASRNSEISSLGAKLMLLDIYSTEKMFEKGRRLLAELEAKYPSSRYILWSKGKYYKETGKYGNAEKVFGELCTAYRTIPQSGRSLLSAQNKRAHMLFSGGKYIAAAKVCKEILQRAESWDDPRVQEIKKDTEKLLKEIGRHGKN